jgi:hypothetical protein
MTRLPDYLDHLTAEERANVLAIRRLNDALRTSGGSSAHGQWFVTIGVRECGPMFVALACLAVAGFNRFSEANDPYGEHDFGAFTLWEKRLNWKIDYYDLDLAGASPNPADPAITVRVLTLMLAEDR